MNKKNIIRFLLTSLAAIIIVFTILTARNRGYNAINQETAIQIARKELKKCGYDIKHKKVMIQKNAAQPWKEFPDYYTDIKKKLKNENYWFIYYYPDGDMFGGDASVFVDAENGKVIGIFLGE